MRATRLLTATAVCLVAACSETQPFAPSNELDATELIHPAAAAAVAEVTVMTRNLYVGTDVDAVIAALATPDPGDDLPTLLAAIETLRRTDFPSRAIAFAEEIARTRPHVIGLQEISQVDLILPPIGIDIHYDFLPTLLGELAARGLDYAVAAQVRNIEATPLPGVTLIDYDAILVDRSRVTVHATTAQRFSANLGPVAPGILLERGWVSATATIDGRTYALASTHLESGDLPGLDLLRAAQAGELVQALAGATPTVLMGDLNDVPGSPMYQVLANAGFTDAWAGLRPGTAGYTCCHASDLSNRLERFEQRVDYIFVRAVGHPKGKVIGQIARVGEVPADRINGPDSSIWPSDHAGLVARLRIPPAGESQP
jgi:endonuclease/exonuclease/phosphatase family metal-dependent hydrolase